MVKLTERLVLARSRASDLENVRKLNCWASDLSDVSIIQRMPNVQIVSLSVNHITTLRDFASSYNLEELYIRKNDIKNLAEICHLCTLPKLRVLWLADNPCALGDRYRMTVLKTLPNLQRLDNIPVQEDEVNEAIEQGIELTKPNPEDTRTVSITQPERKDSESTSTISETTTEKDKMKELDFEGINGCVLQQKAPPSSPEASEKVSTAEGDRDSSSAEEVEEEEMEDKEEEKEEGTNVTPEKEKQTDLLTVEQAGAPVEETMEDDLEEGEVTIDNPYEETNQIRAQLGLKPLSKEKTTQPVRSRPSHSTRARNANLLQAALCLIRELDVDSLEIVSDAIRNTLEGL